MKMKFGVKAALAAALLFVSGAAAQSINPASQISWPRVTGHGTPTAAGFTCAAGNVGQPYTDLTNSNQYNCMSPSGTPTWTQVNGGSGSGLSQLTGDVTAGPGSGSQTSTLAHIPQTPLQTALNANTYTVNTVINAGSSLSAAVTACGSANTTIQITQTIAVGTGITVPANCTLLFQSAGNLTGTSITINGAVLSPPVQIFGAGLAVTGLRGAVTAEWFGVAQPYASISAAAAGADDSTKAQAAISSVTRGGWLQLQCGYYHFNALTFTTSENGIKGTCHGWSYPSASQASVIVSSSATATQIAFGNGAGGAQIQWSVLEDVAIQRSVHPTSGAIGLSLDNVGGMYLHNVKVEDSLLLGYFHMAPSFNFGDYTLSGDWGLGPVSPSAYAADTPKGFWMDSADGNEENSLNLVDSAVDCAALAGTGAVTTGYLISGTAISDVNVSNSATAGCNHASRITYTGSTTGVAQNVRFDNFVADGSVTDSVLIENVRPGAHSSGGSVVYNGGQLAGGASCNVDVENSLGVSFTGKIHIDSGIRSCVNGSSDVSFDAQFNNIGFPDTKALVFSGTVNSRVSGTFTNLSSTAATNIDIEFDSTSINNVVDGSTFSLAATNAVKCDGTSGANVVGVNTYDPNITTPTTGCGTSTLFLNQTGNYATPSGGSATVIQINGTPTSTATPVNIQTSTANTVGLTITPSNPSVGNVKMEITGGAYTGTAANLSGTPTVPNGTSAATQAAADNSIKLATTAYADRVGVNILAANNVFTGLNNMVGAANSVPLNMLNSTPATNVANQSSPCYGVIGQYWTGTASNGDAWSICDVLGSGTNPTSTLTFGHVGSSGLATVALPALTLTTPLASGSGGTGEAGTFTGIRKANSASADTAATGLDVNGVLACADTSASGTAQTCTTSPSFTPAANSCVIYTTTTANSGAGLTLNVNSLGAKSVAKWLGTTTLAAGDVAANSPQQACYNGTVWNLSTIGNAPGGGGSVSITAASAAITVSPSPITGSGTVDLNLAHGNTWTALQQFSVAGAASTPGFSWTGPPFTGGSGTTDLPYAYINNGATGPTTFSTSGTEFGINAPSGWAGNFLDFHVNGAAAVAGLSSNGSFTGRSFSANSGVAQLTNTGYMEGGAAQIIGGKFTTSGCSVSASTGGSSGGIFTLGANSCTVVVTMGTGVSTGASNGWTCQAHDRTASTVVIGGESSSTTTTASIIIPAGAGTTDVISFSCDAF